MKLRQFLNKAISPGTKRTGGPHHKFLGERLSPRMMRGEFTPEKGVAGTQHTQAYWDDIPPVESSEMIQPFMQSMTSWHKPVTADPQFDFIPNLFYFEADGGQVLELPWKFRMEYDDPYNVETIATCDCGTHKDYWWGSSFTGFGDDNPNITINEYDAGFVSSGAISVKFWNKAGTIDLPAGCTATDEGYVWLQKASAANGIRSHGPKNDHSYPSVIIEGEWAVGGDAEGALASGKIYNPNTFEFDDVTTSVSPGKKWSDDFPGTPVQELTTGIYMEIDVHLVGKFSGGDFGYVAMMPPPFTLEMYDLDGEGGLEQQDDAIGAGAYYRYGLYVPPAEGGGANYPYWDDNQFCQTTTNDGYFRFCMDLLGEDEADAFDFIINVLDGYEFGGSEVTFSAGVFEVAVRNVGSNFAVMELPTVAEAGYMTVCAMDTRFPNTPGAFGSGPCYPGYYGPPTLAGPYPYSIFTYPGCWGPIYPGPFYGYPIWGIVGSKTVRLDWVVPVAKQTIPFVGHVASGYGICTSCNKYGNYGYCSNGVYCSPYDYSKGILAYAYTVYYGWSDWDEDAWWLYTCLQGAKLAYFPYSWKSSPPSDIIRDFDTGPIELRPGFLHISLRVPEWYTYMYYLGYTSDFYDFTLTQLNDQLDRESSNAAGYNVGPYFQCAGTPGAPKWTLDLRLRNKQTASIDFVRVGTIDVNGVVNPADSFLNFHYLRSWHDSDQVYCGSPYYAIEYGECSCSGLYCCYISGTGPIYDCQTCRNSIGDPNLWYTSMDPNCFYNYAGPCPCESPGYPACCYVGGIGYVYSCASCLGYTEGYGYGYRYPGTTAPCCNAPAICGGGATGCTGYCCYRFGFGYQYSCSGCYPYYPYGYYYNQVPPGSQDPYCTGAPACGTGGYCCYRFGYGYQYDCSGCYPYYPYGFNFGQIPSSSQDPCCYLSPPCAGGGGGYIPPGEPQCGYYNDRKPPTCNYNYEVCYMGRQTKVLTVPLHALHLASGQDNLFIGNSYEWEIMGFRIAPVLGNVTYSPLDNVKMLGYVSGARFYDLYWTGTYPYGTAPWSTRSFQAKTKLFLGAQLTRIRDVDSI